MEVSNLRGESDDTVSVWLRRSESEAAREKLDAAVYEDPHRKTSISPRVGECINRKTSKVQRIVPTSRSVLR